MSALSIIIKMDKGRSKVIRDVEKSLKNMGLTYELQEGKKHWMLRVEGEAVCMISHGAGSGKGCDIKNIMARVKNRRKKI